jgi:tRNA modification GTPase
MALRSEILGWVAQMEAQIDFPDDDIPPTPQAELQQRAASLLGKTRQLLDTADQGRIYRDGLRVALVGKPNVGKSSLLNLLLGEDRAIVTDVAGTTRDSIEEWANLGGVPLCLIDTAGIREATDKVESIGIERSQQAIERSDVVVVVLDTSRPWDGDDERLAGLVAGRPGVVVLNKCDLPLRLQVPPMDLTQVSMSVLRGAGLVDLKTALLSAVSVSGPVEECVVASARHRESLWRAADSLERVALTIEQHLPVDFLTIDLRAALDAMGEVTGQSITEDVLDKIFSEFCLGK